MRKTMIEEASLGVSDLAKTANDLLTYFNGSEDDASPKFDASKEIHGTDLSFSDCVVRITSIADIADKFGTSKDFLMVPKNRINSFKQRIDETQNHINSLNKYFRQVLRDGGDLDAFVYETFHIRTKNGHQHDLRAHFKNFSDSTEGLLEAFYSVLTVLRPTRSTFSFLAAANAMSSLIETSSAQIHALDGEIENLRNAVAEASNHVVRVQTHATTAKEAADETTRAKDEGGKDRKTIGEYLAEVTNKKTAVETIHSTATELKKEVESYSEKFQLFDQQLEGRNKDFDQGKTQQTSLFADFDKKRNMRKHCSNKLRAYCREQQVLASPQRT